MVGFDGVSLFTKVPTGDALRVIEDLLAEDDTLRDRTTLLPTDIVSLSPDFVSTPPTFTLEVIFMSKLQVRPWVLQS